MLTGQCLVEAEDVDLMARSSSSKPMKASPYTPSLTPNHNDLGRQTNISTLVLSFTFPSSHFQMKSVTGREFQYLRKI